MIEQLLPEFFKHSKDISPRQRRETLIEEMSSLDGKKLTCANCVGNCCTFTSNSMRITPLEAVEILLFLEESKSINNELILKLEKNITEFRLDKETSFGIKKNYTCPFYLGSCQGCSISRGSKPYGCLAFNATETGVLQGTTCKSNQTLLESREDFYNEHEKYLNHYIKTTLQLTWEKESIPVALLDIIKKGELCSPQI